MEEQRYVRIEDYLEFERERRRDDPAITLIRLKASTNAAWLKLVTLHGLVMRCRRCKAAEREDCDCSKKVWRIGGHKVEALLITNWEIQLASLHEIKVSQLKQHAGRVFGPRLLAFIATL